jgi:PleD family two-component response regulator
MKKAYDAIYIITLSAARAEALKQAIDLRDFDELLCIPYDNAAVLLKANPPALAIIDTEDEPSKTSQLLSQLPSSVKSLVLSNAFDEELFVTCHDHGARDFLVKPISDAYLVSRVLRVLQERRLEQVMGQKDLILEDLGVLSARSGVFSTEYLLKLLKKATEEVSPYATEPLSLLLIQLEGYPSPLPTQLEAALYRDVARMLKECARGFDIVGECFMDKFAVILPDTGSRGGRALARRVIDRLDGYEFQSAAGRLKLRVRTGLGEYVNCRHYEDLMNRALDDLRRSASQNADVQGNPLHPV